MDETVMMRHLLEGLPVFISESATSSGEAREYLRDNPETRLVLLDDGMQHLPLVRCAFLWGGGDGSAEVVFAAVVDLDGSRRGHSTNYSSQPTNTLIKLRLVLDAGT